MGEYGFSSFFFYAYFCKYGAKCPIFGILHHRLTSGNIFMLVCWLFWVTPGNKQTNQSRRLLSTSTNTPFLYHTIITIYKHCYSFSRELFVCLFQTHSLFIVERCIMNICPKFNSVLNKLLKLVLGAKTHKYILSSNCENVIIFLQTLFFYDWWARTRSGITTVMNLTLSIPKSHTLSSLGQTKLQFIDCRSCSFSISVNLHWSQSKMISFFALRS